MYKRLLVGNNLECVGSKVASVGTIALNNLNTSNPDSELRGQNFVILIINSVRSSSSFGTVILKVSSEEHAHQDGELSARVARNQVGNQSRGLYSQW